MQRTYTVAREGFLMNRYKRIGDKVLLHERQASYLIHAGQLENPQKTPSVNEMAAAIFAADPNAPKAASGPETADAPPEPTEEK